jgi:hypothetical protein
MADVSVEFGAKDVGLQDSLKKIQTEMQTLEGKVKSGELSFEELESTMKRLGQVERLEKQLQAIGNESAGAAPKVDELGKDIQDTGNKSEKMGEQSGMGFAKFVAGVGLGQVAAKAFTAVLDSAFAAVRGTIQGFTDALDLGGRLSDLSASTGETAGKLLVLERAFDTSGIGADKVGSSIAKMQKNIEDARDGSGTAANAFAAMGVSVDELDGKLPTEAFKILSSGINSIEDPTKRAAAAMGAFGKTEAELLPFLTNLDGELANARDTVGSMAEIMDRRNATFDAVSDRFKTIGEKVRDFAAGILDKALPAIDAITSALSRIDAAKIGQNLADAFLGGEKAMSGFQAAVDAFKTGQISAGLGLLWESTKLQSMQTGNEIYKNLTAAFNTVASTIAKIFGPGSGTFTLIVDSFALIGKASAQKLGEGILGILPDINNGLLKTLEIMAIALPGVMGPISLAAKAADVALEGLRGSMGGMKEDVEAQKEELTTIYNKFAANAKKSFSEIPEDFKTNLQSVPPLFDGITAQQNKVAELEKEVAAKVVETNAERAKSTEQLEKEKEERAKIRAKAEEDAAKEKANAVELIELETQINTAKAAGNEELAKLLENEKKRLENEQEIKKLTEEYKPLVGDNADEAARLATNFVNAKDAAAGVAVDKTTVTEAKKEAAEAATAAKSFATWLDYIKGVDPSAPVKSLKEQTADARKEITAFGEYIGTDLKNKSFPDVARELGIKNLGDTGTEQMNQILAHIASKRGELTGIQPIDEKGGNTAIDGIQTKLKELSTKTTTVPLDGDTTQLDQSVSAFTAKPLTLSFDADTDSAAEKLKELEKPIVLQFDTSQLDQAIAEMQTDIANSFVGGSGGPGGLGGDGGAGGEGGQGGDASLGTLQRIVETIKTVLEKIEPKLPTAALTA